MASPPEGGTVQGGGFYQPGDVATLTAFPAPGWQFDGWEGEGVTESDLLAATVLMDGRKTVTAHFITDYEAWTRSHDLVDDDALPTADPDGDGLSNDLEFRFGFDPKDSSSRLTLAIRRGAEGYLVLTINRVIAEGSFVLETSGSPAGPWDGEIPVPVEAAAWNHEVPIPITGNIGFLRLRYSP